MGANTLGNNFCLTTFGESHGIAIGGVIDGCPSGLLIDFEKINEELEKYSEKLANKMQIIAANKADVLQDEENFEKRREDINKILIFHGITYCEDGEFRECQPAKTISEAEALITKQTKKEGYSIINIDDPYGKKIFPGTETAWLNANGHPQFGGSQVHGKTRT